MDTFKEVLETLNPLNVSWNNAGDVALYVASLAIFLSILGILYFGFRNISNVKNFITSMFAELRKVTWLSKEDTYKFSLITVAMIVVSTIFIVLTDQAFLLLRGVLISTGA